MDGQSRNSQGIKLTWLVMLVAVLAAACGDSISEIERVPEADVASEPQAPWAAAASGSGRQFDSANAQVVAGGLGEPNSDPAAFVQGDSIVRDSAVVGHLRQSQGSGSSSYPDFGLAPGQCLVLIFYYLDTGEIIGYSVIHCEPPEGDDGRSGGNQGGGGTEPTDTTAVTIGLSCSSSVRRGEVATCSITKNPTNATVTNVSWKFSNSDVTNRKQNGESWRGQAASTGTVTVTGNAGGNGFVLTKVVTVLDRGWQWPVTAEWASGNEVDSCVGRQAGAVVQANCSSHWFDQNGFSIVQGSGPWAGLYYVSDPRAGLDLKAALNPSFRADGPLRPLAGGTSALVAGCRRHFGPTVLEVNRYQANTVCTTTAGFTRAISIIQSHEQRHLDAGVRAATAGDLYEDWDGIVAKSRGQARNLASDEAKRAHDRVNRAIMGTHTGSTITVHFWTFTSGRWSMGGAHLQN